MTSFNEEYYNNNKQEKDRIDLFFYSNIVKNYFKPKVVLDYGCGTGFFLKRLSKINNIQNTFGFELSDYARNEAIKNSPLSKIINNLNQIDSDSVDLIVSLHVIEHVKDDDLTNIFSSFKRILKKNGSILVSTPAKNGLANILKKEKWIAYTDITHINLTSYKEWELFFKNQKLCIKKSASDGLWDYPYKTDKNVFLKIKIYILMFFQIFFGKLLLKNKEGETFIFFLVIE